MLVGTENTSEQFITRLAVDTDNHGDLHGDGYRIFVISMDMVDILLKVETRKTAYGIQPYGTDVI